MTDPSPHLSWREVACWDRSAMPWRFVADYPPLWATRLRLLAQEFERVRYLIGSRPIIVLSAYRTPAYNRRVGGAVKSQHLMGRALDLAVPEGLSVVQFYDACLTVAHEQGSRLRGLGRYDHFVHIDTRPTKRIARWDGHHV